MVDSRDDLLAIIRQEFQSLLQQFPPSSATPLSQPIVSASPGLVVLLAFSARFECACVLSMLLDYLSDNLIYVTDYLSDNLPCILISDCLL